MRTDRIRTAVAGTFVALVIAMSPAYTAEATPDPSEPPAEEPTDPAPDDTAPEDSEPAPEPGDVSPAVWVGAIVLLVVAVAWAVRQTTKPTRSPTSPD